MFSFTCTLQWTWIKPCSFVIFVNDSSLTFGTFLQVALRWRIEKEVIDGKGKKLNLYHNYWWFWEFKVHLIFLKIHFENENFYFGNWNIISDMLKIKISFNIWTTHRRNWDFFFGNHFDKVPFGDVNLDCRSQKSPFENISLGN